MLKPISDTEYIFRFLNQNEFIETCDRRYLEPVRLIGVNISSEIVSFQLLNQAISVIIVYIVYGMYTFAQISFFFVL